MTQKKSKKPNKKKPSQDLTAADARELAGHLKHSFKNADLLERALTHASATPATGPDNERMEFLGDRVLGLVVADALLTRFPAATEGEMAPRLNKLVRRETCAEVARDLDLGRYLHLAPAEVAQGGRTKTAILANAMEAVIAALYMDGGLEPARSFILEAWKSSFDAVAEIPRDAKTVLQEKLHALGQSHPKYKVVGQQGSDHAPVFEVEVDAGQAGAACGSGSSKRNAEQAAAAALLTKLGNES
ncbi:MAG: ribonuclease III [Candidatus Phaeomarinobacter sp.]